LEFPLWRLRFLLAFAFCFLWMDYDKAGESPICARAKKISIFAELLRKLRLSNSFQIVERFTKDHEFTTD